MNSVKRTPAAKYMVVVDAIMTLYSVTFYILQLGNIPRDMATDLIHSAGVGFRVARTL